MVHHVEQMVMISELLDGHHILETQTDDDMVKTSKLKPTNQKNWKRVSVLFFFLLSQDFVWKSGTNWDDKF